MVDFERLEKTRKYELTLEERCHEDDYYTLVKKNTFLEMEYVYEKRKGNTLVREVNIMKLRKSVGFNNDGPHFIGDTLILDFNKNYWTYVIDDKFMHTIRNNIHKDFCLDMQDEVYITAKEMTRILDKIDKLQYI